MKRPGGFDDSANRAPTVPRVAVPEPQAPRPPVPLEPRATEDSAIATDSRDAHSQMPVTGQAEVSQLPRPADAIAGDEAQPSTSAPVEASRGGSKRGVRRARARLRRAERERRGRERSESRRFTAHRRNRRRVWAIVAASVLGLALFVAAGVFTPIMAVRDVQVQGVQTMNAEDLQHALSRFEGVPLALVNDTEIHRALEPFPLVQRYAIQRIPPNTLLVRIEERSPVVALERNGGEYELLDPAGVVLARVAEVPVGVPIGNAELSDTSTAAFRAATAVIRDLPEDVRAMITRVHATNAQDVRFTLDSGSELVWGAASETQRKAVVLRSLIAATGMPTMIDVSAPEAPVFR